MILDIVRALALNFISWSFTPGGGEPHKSILSFMHAQK